MGKGVGILAVVAIVVIAVGSLFAALYMGFIQIPVQSIAGGDQINGGADAGIEPEDLPAGTAKACLGGQTQSYDPNTHDSRTPATALTETTNSYRKVGESAWTTFTAGTAITGLEVGKDYEFVYGVTAADAVDNAFGPHVFVRNLDCVKVDNTALSQDAAASAVTTTFFNQNDAASYAAMTASTDETVSFKFQANQKVYYGNPYIKDDPTMSDNGNHRKAYPNCACLQANDTWFDTADTVSYILDGNGNRVDMHKVGTPTQLAAATGDTAVCFEAPVVTDAAYKQYFTIDMANAVAGDDGTLTLYAGDYYIDADSAELKWGCESDAGAAIGISTAETGTFDVTA